MNKVVTSAGLLALGASAVYGYDPEMTRSQTGRPWTVSAIVRGFYDDNPTTSADKTPIGATGRFIKPDDSFGFELAPSIHVNLPLEQTFIRAGYTYSYRYFEDREPRNYDQSHEFDAVLRHAFSPRHDITISDGFYYSSEPTVVEKNGIITSPIRTSETALHNHGAIDYNVGFTPSLGLALGYANEWFDYDQDGNGSRSALLDRIEHYIHADLRYQATEKLVALVGYQIGLINYTGDEFIFPNDPTSPKSSIRDSVSHFIYVGADHDFSPNLRGTVRLGGQFTDYVHADEDEVSPYADASLSYVYARGSTIRVGIKHMRAATDLVAVDDKKGQPTLDQETTAAYVELTHQITANLTGHLLGQVQHSAFNGGLADEKDLNETLYLLGLNLTYRINNHWSTEVGYNYDMLDSDLKSGEIGGKRYELRSFDRNRVYVGVRATY